MSGAALLRSTEAQTFPATRKLRREPWDPELMPGLGHPGARRVHYLNVALLRSNQVMERQWTVSALLAPAAAPSAVPSRRWKRQRPAE